MLWMCCVLQWITKLWLRSIQSENRYLFKLKFTFDESKWWNLSTPIATEIVCIDHNLHFWAWTFPPSERIQKWANFFFSNKIAIRNFDSNTYYNVFSTIKQSHEQKQKNRFDRHVANASAFTAIVSRFTALPYIMYSFHY